MNFKTLPPNLTELENIRPVAIHPQNHITNGIDHLDDAHSPVEEQTEDINVANSYSANDSDGHSTVIVPPPSDQIVVNIGEDADGSPPNMSREKVVSLALNTGTNSSDQPRQKGTRNISCIWIALLVTDLGLWALSTCFGFVATEDKLQYALYGMVLSIVSGLLCILELIYNVVKLTGASASDMFWGILPELFGLALACIQYIIGEEHYSFLRRRATYPARVSFEPILCYLILLAFKYRNGRN